MTVTLPGGGTWSYQGVIVFGEDGYSPLDEVRYLVQDTDQDVPLLSDQEVGYQIKQWIGDQNTDDGTWSGGAYDHPLMAAHGCALRIAAKFAGVVSVGGDGTNVGLSDLSPRYTALADALREEYERIRSTGADVDLDNLLVGSGFDPSIRPLSFGIGMHDNPEAGQQDFGGSLPSGFDDLVSP